MMTLGSLLLSALAIARVVFADPSDGCNESDTSRYVASKEFTFQDRNVLVSFPPDYKATKPATLIFAYHDVDMTAKEMEKLTKFNNKKMNKNAIVVYPAPLNVSRFNQG
jgi:poly(3-hydroxybutyrate) depolymerase